MVETMQTETKRRLALYPLALMVLCGLVYGGFIYQADPDAQTLVNSAEILAQCGMFDEAIARGKEALAQEPGHLYGHVVVAYAYPLIQHFQLERFGSPPFKVY